MVVWENAATPRMGQDEKGKDGRRSCSSNISDQLEGRRPDEPAYRAVINYKTSLMADLRLEFGYFLFLRERHYGKGQLSNQIPQSTGTRRGSYWQYPKLDLIVIFDASIMYISISNTLTSTQQKRIRQMRKCHRLLVVKE